MRAIFLLLAALLWCGNGHASVPRQISYSEYLTSSGGTPVNATVAIVVNFYDVPLRFLCDTKDTAGAWSLMEEDIPAGHGPPQHRHD